jgi:TP901 family phage tail tape measure protein
MSVKQDIVNLVVTVNGEGARKQMAGLEKQAFDIRDRMKELKKGTDEWIKANDQLKNVNNKMLELRATIDLNNKSTRDLNADLRQLMSVRQILQPGTEAFEKNKEAIIAVKKRLFELNAEIKVGEGFWSKMKTQALQFGTLAAGYVGFQALIGKTQSLFKANYDLSDSFADVMKTTGLTELQMDKLNSRLSKINTRSSREELLKLASDAGKLGESSVEGVEKFVKQADIIKVSLKEDLGDDAIISIAKLSKIFKTEMLNIASSINSIGQASEASEQYQVDFLSRLAGVSQTAKLSAPDLLGYSAALEINGQAAEKSGTALTTFFIDFVKDTEKYGKAAGFAKGELTKLIGDKGTNVAFIEFLQRLKAGSVSSQDLLEKMESLGIDGARGAGIFLTLSNNIGLVSQQQKIANDSFTKGTSVIDEFNTRNENFAALMDKFQKQLAGWFSGSGIMKVMKDLLQSFTSLFDTKSNIDKATESWRKSTQALQDFDANVNPLIKRYDELKSKTALTKDEQEELKKVITAIGDYVPTAISEFGKYGEAIGINTEKVKAYREALVSMNKIKNADGLKAANDAIKEVQSTIDKLDRDLNNRDKNGDLVKIIPGGYGTVSIIKLTNEEIQKLRSTLSDKKLELEGHQNIVNELTGITVYATDATKAMNALTASSGAGNNDTPLTGGSGPGDTERSKELEKLQKELDNLIGKIKDVDKQFATSKLNSDDQAFENIRDRYQPLIDQARGNGLNGEADQLLNQMIEALNKKKEEFRQRDLLEQQKANDSIFNALQDENGREINAEAEKWDALILQAQKYHLDDTALLTAKTAAINNITKKQNLKEQTDAETQRKKLHEIELKRVKDTKLVTDAVAGIFSNMFELLATQEGEYTEYQRGLAFVQLGIDAATSISGAIAGASDLPFPANLAAYATSVAEIFGFMAQAKKFFQGAAMPERKLESGGAIIPDGPSHADGGLKIVDSKTNKIVAEGEGRELYVFSKNFVRKNPDLVNAIMDASNNNNGVLRRPVWMDAMPRVINMSGMQRATRFEKFENGGQILEFMPESYRSTNPHIKTGRAVVNKELEDLLNKIHDTLSMLVTHIQTGIVAHMQNDQFDRSRKDWEQKKKNSLLAS